MRNKGKVKGQAATGQTSGRTGLYQPKFSSSCPLGAISGFSSSRLQACGRGGKTLHTLSDTHDVAHARIPGMTADLLDDGVGCRCRLRITIIYCAFQLIERLRAAAAASARCPSRLHRASELSVLVGQAQNDRVLRPGSTHGHLFTLIRLTTKARINL